ncbi:glycerol-3-phosphate dehydrogenase [Desulfuromonas versatilis]|uniref:glycerol-3-phosphate dehydrogenase n=1 Tax=Desulfuromonas versatilis TaxID=2802975 RepID=UPI001C85E02A|nr:glycerol-3-phosphate dehydrogenase [Desulfuromonas versatilis]
MATPPSPACRDPQRLTRRRYDVLVVGGGINGAGICRDLALRGLSVALVDKGDFGCGASSASTKLVHGGLRYLERLNFRLVFEACRERRILQKIAPHLVRPMPFFIPVYRGDARSLPTIRAGMLLYDLLALFRNTHHHSILSPAAALEREPALRAESLAGVAVYWDCRMDDARLCLENVLSAVAAGAEACNYLEVTGLLKRGHQVCGARLRDLESGRELEVEAATVINACGPWLDGVCALDGEQETKLRPTRGTHILVPALHRGREALYLSAGGDQRLFFVIPWGELSMVGTTDVDFTGHPDTVEPTTEDIDYLLRECSRQLRCGPIARSQVVAAFSGLRPLVREDAAVQTGRVSREHRIYISGSGLISVGGGKYTTYRAVAAEVASLVAERLGRGQGPSLTQRIPLAGGVTGDFHAFRQRRLAALAGDFALAPDQAGRLLDRYGSRTGELLELARREPELLQPVCRDSTLLAAEVAFAVDCEWARTPEDILRRRTGLTLTRGRGLAELAAVSALMGRRLGWDAGRGDRMTEAYQRQNANAIPGKDLS